MADNTNIDKDENLDKVLQKDLDQKIISIIDSENNLSNDFYDVFDALEKNQRQVFLFEFIDWLSTKKASRYLNKKYLVSRNTGNPIFKYNRLEYERAKLDDKLYLNGIRSEDDLKFPATEYWIHRKSWEMSQIISELVSLSKNLYPSKVNNPNTSNYQFPEHLIDSEFNSELIESFRIPINSSIENLKTNIQKSLSAIQSILNKEEFEAFMHNSFQFRENKTQPTPLRLPISKKVKMEVFLSYFYHLYEDIDDNYKIAKTEFVKILLLNFKKYRTDFSDKNFQLDRYLSKIEKRVRKNNK